MSFLADRDNGLSHPVCVHDLVVLWLKIPKWIELVFATTVSIEQRTDSCFVLNGAQIQARKGRLLERCSVGCRKFFLAATYLVTSLDSDCFYPWSPSQQLLSCCWVTCTRNYIHYCSVIRCWWWRSWHYVTRLNRKTLLYCRSTVLSVRTLQSGLQSSICQKLLFQQLLQPKVCCFCQKLIVEDHNVLVVGNMSHCDVKNDIHCNKPH